MLRRVVVTGLGCVSPLGNSASTTWENLIAGKCGLSQLESDGEIYETVSTRSASYSAFVCLLKVTMLPNNFSIDIFIAGIEHLPCQIGGTVKNFDESSVLNSNERRSANRTTGFAMSAAVEAMENAQFDLKSLNRDRAGVCFGSSLAGFMETVSQMNLQRK